MYWRQRSVPGLSRLSRSQVSQVYRTHRGKILRHWLFWVAVVLAMSIHIAVMAVGSVFIEREKRGVSSGTFESTVLQNIPTWGYAAIGGAIIGVVIWLAMLNVLAKLLQKEPDRGKKKQPKKH